MRPGPTVVASTQSDVVIAKTIKISHFLKESKFPLPHLSEFRPLISGLQSDTIQPLVTRAEAWQAIPGVSKWVLGIIKYSYSLQFALKQILTQICPEDWFFSLDLKDAYFHIQIAPHHRRFLRFAFEGVAYQYAVLPFGLSLAPRTFTK
ncbi:MAG: reverse transcriptase domain-containing protein, partial [Plesiomonas shigelloides]